VALSSFLALCTLRAGVDPHSARQTLSALYAKGPSPFAASDRTHFARLQVIDEVRMHKPRALDHPVLVFSADVDGDVESYLLEVLGASAATFAEVLHLCADAPDDATAPGFAPRATAFLLAHELTVGLPYVNSPGATAVGIRRAVLRRRQLAEFAVTHQAKSPAERRKDFLELFANARGRTPERALGPKEAP